MSDHMKSNITPEDVLAYDLGLADEHTVARIVEARLRNDPQLARLEELYGISPGENEESTVEEEQVPVSIAHVLDQHRKTLERETVGKQADTWKTEIFPVESLRALQELQRLPPYRRAGDPRWPVVLKLDAKQFGGARTPWRFREKIAGKPGDESQIVSKTPEKSAPDAPQMHLWTDGDMAFLEYPEADIPFGLGWLILEEEDAPATLFLPRLMFNPNTHTWFFEASIEEILAGRRPKGKVIPRFIPATLERARAFDGEEVRAFIESLPRRRHQRQCAERFLSMKEQWHGETE